MDVTDPTPLIDGVLPSNAVTVLSGPIDIGKSTVALDWAIHLTNYEDWCDHAVENLYRVVYIVGQDWDVLGQHLKNWEENHVDRKADFVCFVDGVNQGIDMSADGMDSRLVKELKYYDPDLIIFDSFSTLTDSKLIDDEEEISRVFTRARNLVSELNTSVLFVDNNDSLSEYADAVVTANKADDTGYFYLSTKEKDGGKQLGMKPQRILGFYIETEGVLSRENLDTRWVDSRIDDVKRATNLTTSQKDRMVDILLHMKDIIETPWKQLIDSEDDLSASLRDMFT